MYNPKPINTEMIEVPKELNELMELLAENVHDIWAKNRMEDGWTYGVERDNHAKTHPCLIAYGDLPESEKKYDRNTAMETIKAICALGYEIVKK